MSPPSPPKVSMAIHQGHASDHLEVDPTSVPERPRSTDTFQEAQIAFKDFDGVHFSPETDEFVEFDENGREIRRVSARSSSGGLSHRPASMLRAPHARPMSYAEPPPDEGMVYYPAPVPRMLNLPKRLSQLPSATVQAKRRSEMISQLPDNVKAGAPWLNQMNLGEGGQLIGHSRGSGSAPRGLLNERMSTNMGNLPHQLRAAMFFEHQSVQHDIEVKSESAVATLDNILAASATAPVSAFIDHPYAGDVRKAVYSPEPPPRKCTTSTAMHSSLGDKKPKKRRSSSIGALLKRTTSSDEVTGILKKRGSRASVLTDLDFDDGPDKLGRRRSQMSLGDELEHGSEAVKTPADEITEPTMSGGLVAQAQNVSPAEDEHRVSRAPTAMSMDKLEDGEQIDEDFKAEEAQEDVEEGDPMFVQPSTLLAELQVRKAQQKSRGRTAATAFPKGMHSTLLELDAVEEINKRKRKQQRIALAWEDPHQRALESAEAEGDDDVPLGMLFPSKNGRTNRKLGDGKDWDRPLGLMEKRELEDGEPLSSRRSRLRGVSPSRGRAPSPGKRHATGLGLTGSQMDLAAQPDSTAEVDEGEDEGETLGQRLRRMKSTNAGEIEDADNQDEALGQRVRRVERKGVVDTALSDVAPKDDGKSPGTFVDEVMSQFGGLDMKDKEADVTAGVQKSADASPNPGEENETLGQRRARLQREREASGEQRNVSGGSGGPLLRTSTSLANLLAANPAGIRAATKEHQPAQGTLLHANQQVEAKHKTQLMNTNMRSSSYNLGKPLVDSRAPTAHEPNTGGLLSQQHSSRALTGGFAAGQYNNGAGGIQGLQTSASTPIFGANGTNSYFASPTAMPFANGHAGNGMMQMQYPQMSPTHMQQPPFHQSMNALAYGGGMMSPGMQTGFVGNGFLPGMTNGTYGAYAQQIGGVPGYGAGAGMGMGMGMGMGFEEPLNNQQRDAIDRWRMSVGQ